jgi:hypothetical protein
MKQTWKEINPFGDRIGPVCNSSGHNMRFPAANKSLKARVDRTFLLEVPFPDKQFLKSQTIFKIQRTQSSNL